MTDTDGKAEPFKVDAPGLAGVDQVLMRQLINVGCRTPEAADALIQAAAIAAVYRHVRTGEPMAVRRAAFNQVIDRNTLTLTPHAGTA